MQLLSSVRLIRLFMIIFPTLLFVAGCGTGDGKESIPGTPAPPPPPPPPANCADTIGFEDACGPFAFADFAGGAVSIVDNPDVSGINTTAKVAQMRKFADQVFGGSTLTLDTPPDFSAGEFFKMRVRAQRAVPVLFKFEGLDQERSVDHSGSGTWEELCFDFSGSTAGPAATGITFIFDLGVNGDAGNDPNNWTFEFDEIEQGTSCAGGPPLALVFSDEFDTAGAPDPAKWNLETGYGPNNDGWGNNEWQNYTSAPENVRVENGNLVISALCPSGTCGVRDGTVTSARINTKDKFEFRYGRIEARIQFPTGPAVWPAFWMLGANLDTVGWPNAGEIDVAEVFNTNSNGNTVHGSMFWCDDSLTAPNPCSDANGGRATDTATLMNSELLSNDFHVYSAEWNENQVTIQFDGQTYFTRTIDPATMEEFRERFFLLLNVAMGGNAGSADQPPNGSEIFPQTMLVDYVRVFSADSGPSSGEDTVIDFEDTPDTYDFGMAGGFGGGASGVIDNPQMTGINMSAQVAQMQKFAGEVFGGSTLALPTPLEITEAGNATMKVWSPRPVNVLLKFEGPVEAEVEVAHGGSGWEDLTFDFSSFTGTVTGLTFIFDLGTVGNADNDPANWTFYYDDIVIPTGTSGGGPGGGNFAPVTFDDPALTYTLSGFGGAEDSTVVADPTGGSNMVVQVNRSNTAEVFAGTVVSTGPNESVGVIPLDAANTTMNVRVYSPAAGIPVRLKIENSGDPAVSVETEATTTAASTWETLTFDFANEVAGTAAFNPAATYDKTAIFFNFGTPGATAGAQTFFFDDIDVGPGGGGGGPGGGTALLDFDDPALTYTFIGFGGGEDGAVEADPDDASNNVGRVNRSASAETFAGTIVATMPNEAIEVIPLDATNTTLTVRVRSALAGIPVRVKIENSGDPTQSVETEATTTVANVWETLTFDFANEAAGTAPFNPAFTYDKFVIFFNFGTAGSGAVETYYFDDVEVGAGSGGGGGMTFSDFESGSAMFADFGGAVSAVIANPDSTGLNTSNFVGQTQKFAGEVFAGSTLDLGGSVALAAGDSYTMLVRAQRAVPVTLKLEPQGDERVANYSGSGAWELLCFDFSGVSGDVTGLTIIFDNGTAGDAAGDPNNWTFQFDDIQQTSDSCGGGSGPTFEPITFDDPAVTYTLRGFGGAEDSTVIQDPSDPANNVVQVNRSAAAETFAGTVVSTLPNEAIGAIPLDAANTTMNVRINSPAAGIPVRLKIENSADPAVSVETEATTTAAGTFEALTFDFANEVAGTAAFNPAATYDKAVIFFNFGTDGATAGAQTFLFDDIDTGPGGGGGGPAFAPIDFDDPALTYTLTGFGGAEDSTIAADPTGGTNNVVQVNRAAGAETFAGTIVSTGPNESIPQIPLDASNTTMNVRVYSPAAGIVVRVKIENSADPTQSVETEATTTVANTWEALTFDFANEAAGTAAFNPAFTYDKFVIFFNFGTAGAPAQTYFFDDIDVGPGGGGGGPGGGTALLDFDDPALTYTFIGFGGGEDAAVESDPDDASNNVGRVNRSAGAETFAGTIVATMPNEAIEVIPLDASNTTLTVRVRSALAGIPVRVKIENSGDPTQSVETEATTTVANAWETLTFDFANEAAGTAPFNPAFTYDKFVIFFNFGTAGSGAVETYYFDDVEVGAGSGGGGGMSSSDFESGSATFNDFGGAVAAVISNPDPSGLNTSTFVGQMQKFAGEVFAGSTLDLGGSVALAAGDSYTMLVRAQRAVPVTFKLEPQGDERVANYSGSGNWELLCFDFAGVAGDVTGITIIFDNGVAGDAAGDPNNWTFQFDDIQQTTDSCSGGGGGTTSLDFEDDPATYDFGAGAGVPGGFGGGQADVIANPDQSGINMSAQVGRMQKFTGEVFGGATLMLASPLDIPASSEVTMKVWAQRAVPVLFKLEGGPVAEVSVTHTGSGWEELTFDFSSVSGSITGITLIFDLGVVGDAAGDPTNWIFYFDDIAVGPAGGGGSGTSLDFEDDAATYDFGAGAGVPGGFGGGQADVIANPDQSGINTSAQVGRMQKFSGEVFGGATLMLASPLNIPANSEVTMKVWAQRAVPVLFKLEGGPVAEVSVTHSGSGWEELTFDFSSVSGSITGITLIFDLGVIGDAAGDPNNWIFYFDDIAVGSAGGGTGGNFVNGDFETGDFTGWILTQIPDNTGSISIDASGQGGRAGSVARLMAAGSDIVGTSDVLIGQVALAAGTIQPGDTIDVSFELFGSLTGAGGVVFVEVIFLDASGSDNGRNFVGPAAPYFPTTTWTPYSGQVTAGTTVGGGSASVEGGVTLELKAACGAIVGGCGVDASFDNVTFTIN